jgi:hypothetical protein
LEGGFRLSIEKENEIAAKGLVRCTVGRNGLDYAIGDTTTTICVMRCGGNQVLFVQDQLRFQLETSNFFGGIGPYQNADYRIVIWIVSIVRNAFYDA